MIPCNNCGEANYNVEDGIQICNECGTVQDGFMQLEMENDTPNLPAFNCSRHLSIAIERDATEQNINANLESSDTEEDKEEEKTEAINTWSSYEAYNIILYKWMKVLSHFICSNKIDNSVLKVWMCYLQQMEVAFFENHNGKPLIRENDCCGLLCLHRDALVLRGEQFANFYNAKNTTKKTQKKTNKSFNGKFELENTIDNAQSEMQQNILNLKGHNASCFYCYCKNNIAPFIFCCCKNPTKWSELEKKKQHINLHINSPDILTLNKLLCLFYIGILLSQESVLMLELLRWCKRGLLPVHSCMQLLEPSMHLSQRDLKFFHYVPYTIQKLNSDILHMSIFLHIQHLPLPSHFICSKRILKAFRLPEHLLSLCESVWKAVMQMKFKHAFHCLELQAAAIIIFVCKMCFGLDGVTELFSSLTAHKVNSQLHELKNKHIRIFNWNAWQRYHVQLSNWASRIEATAYNGAPQHVGMTKSKLPLPFWQFYWSRGVWHNPRHISRYKQPWKTALSERLLECNNSSGLQEQLQSQPSNHQLLKHSISEWPLIYVELHGKHASNIHTKSLLSVAQELCKVDFHLHLPCLLKNKNELKRVFTTLGKTCKIVAVSRIQLRQNIKELICLSEDDPSMFLVPNLERQIWQCNLKSCDEKDWNSARTSLPDSFVWLLEEMASFCHSNPGTVFQMICQIEDALLKIQ